MTVVHEVVKLALYFLQSDKRFIVVFLLNTHYPTPASPSMHWQLLLALLFLVKEAFNYGVL